MTVGHIYKIVSKHTNKIYIGSTTKPLIQRLLQHENNYRRYKCGKMNYITSFKLLDYNNYSIKLIESIDFDTKDELRKLEGVYIQTFKAICVNRNIAGQTKNESSKIYRVQNKDKISIYKKEYYIQNKDKIEKYRIQNKEKISMQRKEYRMQNKAQIAQHNNEILNCTCGKTYTKHNKAYHEKTKFHIANFNIST